MSRGCRASPLSRIFAKAKATITPEGLPPALFLRVRVK